LLPTPFAVDYADDSITLSDLRTRWEYDPLKKSPRFQKILAENAPDIKEARDLAIQILASRKRRKLALPDSLFMATTIATCRSSKPTIWSKKLRS
jgi:hypothetical protein